MQIRVFIQGAARPCLVTDDALTSLAFLLEHNYHIKQEKRTPTGIDVVVVKLPATPALA